MKAKKKASETFHSIKFIKGLQVISILILLPFNFVFLSLFFLRWQKRKWKFIRSGYKINIAKLMDYQLHRYNPGCWNVDISRKLNSIERFTFRFYFSCCLFHFDNFCTKFVCLKASDASTSTSVPNERRRLSICRVFSSSFSLFCFNWQPLIKWFCCSNAMERRKWRPMSFVWTT